MLAKVFSFWVALLAMIVGIPVTALAATESRPIHPWYSNSRAQIGFLPIPITDVPPVAPAGMQNPNGRIRPPGPAIMITQNTTASAAGSTFHTTASGVATHATGRKIHLGASALTVPGSPHVDFGVFQANPVVFQVGTDLTIGQVIHTAGSSTFGSGSTTFSVGGRTGASTVAFCPGQVVTPNGNPNCLVPGGGVIPGRLTYTKLRNQFGGAGGASFAGGADVALKAAGTPPCDHTTGPCAVAFDNVTPAPEGAPGNAFGFMNSTTGPPNSSFFNVKANALGKITAITATGMAGPPINNLATSYGGPWTTGRVKIEQPAALAGPETYTLTGYDSRVSGTGIVSLVGGAVSDRGTSGPNANRAWLKLQVPEPGATLGAAAALLALVGCHSLARRRS